MESKPQDTIRVRLSVRACHLMPKKQTYPIVCNLPLSLRNLQMVAERKKRLSAAGEMTRNLIGVHHVFFSRLALMLTDNARFIF